MSVSINIYARLLQFDQRKHAEENVLPCNRFKKHWKRAFIPPLQPSPNNKMVAGFFFLILLKRTKTTINIVMAQNWTLSEVHKKFFLCTSDYAPLPILPRYKCVFYLARAKFWSISKSCISALFWWVKPWFRKATFNTATLGNVAASAGRSRCSVWFYIWLTEGKRELLFDCHVRFLKIHSELA